MAAFPVAAFPVPGFPAAAFPVPGFPVAALSMPGLPAAGISVAALQLAMSPKACAAVREALASAAGTHSIAAAIAQLGQAPIPGPTTAVAADMATMALLLLALLLVTPTVDPTVARLTSTTARAAIGPSATRRARAGASAWSTSAIDVPGVSSFVQLRHEPVPLPGQPADRPGRRSARRSVKAAAGPSSRPARCARALETRCSGEFPRCSAPAEISATP